jgi:hypothetical protein
MGWHLDRHVIVKRHCQPTAGWWWWWWWWWWCDLAAFDQPFDLDKACATATAFFTNSVNNKLNVSQEIHGISRF